MAADHEIAGYSNLVEVARGGFGVVFRAHQDRFDRVVALKVLTVSNLDDHARRRFERECRTMGNLSWHPHVVAVHDSGITDRGHPYLAMEYLDAGSLADRVLRQPLPWPEAASAGIEVAGALGAAHAAGTLHRDLKPENILIGPFGESKLGDFGIAAVDSGTRTATGHASYTLTHVAPEVLRGQRPDERADLYGLASTIHTLVAGAPPFAGPRDEAIAAIITRVLQAPAPRLPGVPEDLAGLLQRSLAKEPEDRPQTVAEFGRALQAVQAANGQPVTTLRISRTAASPIVEGSRDDADRTIHLQPTPPAEPEAAPPLDPNATITVPATPVPKEPLPAQPTPPPPHPTPAPGPPPMATQPPAPPPTPPAETSRLGRRPRVASVGVLVGFGGLILLLLSLPLPWYEFDFGDFVRRTNGFESLNIDGVPTAATLFVVAIAVALVVIGSVRGRHRWRGITLIILGAYTLTQVWAAFKTADSITSFSLSAHLEIGFPVALLAAGALVTGGFLDLLVWEKQRSTG